MKPSDDDIESALILADGLDLRVWWCEEHLCSGEGPSFGCWKSDLITGPKDPCRMVERFFVDVDPQPVATEAK